MENTSGQGKAAVVPDEVKGWSWGAFLFNWIWAIGNRTWIGLLVFVPFIGFIMSFVLGFKGREWAWRNKRWDSVEHFNRVQKRWSFWAVIWFLGIILVILAAVAIPAYLDYQRRVQEAEAKVAPSAPARPATVGAKPLVSPPPITASVPAPSATPAPTAPAAATHSTAATPKARLMTPEELKKFNAEFEKNTTKSAEAKQQQPVKESAAQSSAATDRGMDTKPKPVMRARMDESPAPPVAATDVVTPEPQKKVITTKFNDVFTAVMYLDPAAVKELLDLGWWVDKPEPGGSTPLIAAVKIDDTAIAELLLKHGANPNVFARGDSALRLARRNHNAAMVALLQRYGATVE